MLCECPAMWAQAFSTNAEQINNVWPSLTLNMQSILVLLLAIAPLPHLPQFGATSEDDDVPTSLRYEFAAHGIRMPAIDTA